MTDTTQTEPTAGAISGQATQTAGDPPAQGENTAHGQALLALTGRVEALETAARTPAPTPPKQPQPAPAVTVCRTVMVRQKGHPDAPCIVTAVTDGKVSGNVFRGTHILHTVEGAAEIDPANTTAEGWFWPPRS